MMSGTRLGGAWVRVAVVALALGLGLTGSGCTITESSLPEFKNAHFYDAQGKFKEDAAKAAYFQLMEYHGYPINENIRKNLFVSDMGLGQFTDVGLAAVVLVNEKKWNYACLEVFLLPHQTIPEHWHVPVESEGIGPKMESWVVRYGSTFTYGAGEPTQGMIAKIPVCQAQFVSMLHEVPLGPGDVTGVGEPGEKHWQQAGPEGCILSEIATYHSGAAVRFSDPKIKF